MVDGVSRNAGMATPMNHVASQQGKTPSQSHHAAANTPPVSTPFSAPANQAIVSPQGSRSSPQTLRRSPATANALLGQVHTATPLNFDSPAAAAAYNVLGIGNLDLMDSGLGNLGTIQHRVDDDEKVKRLQSVIEILEVSLATACLARFDVDDETAIPGACE